MSLDDIRYRVRGLARKDQLQKQLHKTDDDALPWSDWLFVVPWLAYASAGVAMYYAAQAPRAANDLPPLSALLPPAALIVFGSLCLLLSKLTVPARERRRKRLFQDCLVVPAWVVQANNHWFAADNKEWWPGNVVFSLDAGAAIEPQRLRLVAGALARLKHQDRRTLPPDQVALAWDLYHEMGPTRTLPVPPSLCQDLQPLCMASVWLPPDPLLHGEALLALVLAGDDAPDAVAMLPQQLMQED